MASELPLRKSLKRPKLTVASLHADEHQRCCAIGQDRLDGKVLAPSGQLMEETPGAASRITQTWFPHISTYRNGMQSVCNLESSLPSCICCSVRAFIAMSSLLTVQNVRPQWGSANATRPPPRPFLQARVELLYAEASEKAVSAGPPAPLFILQTTSTSTSTSTFQDYLSAFGEFARADQRLLDGMMAYPSPGDEQQAHSGAQNGGGDDTTLGLKRQRSATEDNIVKAETANTYGAKSEGATGPRLYSCGMCSKSYARLDHLSRHVRMRMSKIP